MPAQPDGAFSAIESAIRAAHGPEASGFELIDRNEDGLSWRLALIDSARHFIDVQTYLWYGDAAGRILAKRLLDAAEHGVKVRMLVDDLNTLFSDAGIGA
jgi:putative cardiolipin synthase